MSTSARDLLRAKAREYELKSAAETERDELAIQQGAVVPSQMPIVWATVAVTLYEVADALSEAEAA